MAAQIVMAVMLLILAVSYYATKPENLSEYVWAWIFALSVDAIAVAVGLSWAIFKS